MLAGAGQGSCQNLERIVPSNPKQINKDSWSNSKGKNGAGEAKGHGGGLAQINLGGRLKGTLKS